MDFLVLTSELGQFCLLGLKTIMFLTLNVPCISESCNEITKFLHFVRDWDFPSCTFALKIVMFDPDIKAHLF